MNQEAIRNVNNLIRQGEDGLIAKDYERALICFRKAYEIDPKNVLVIINMGFCYAKLEKFSQAQECFTTALDLSPKNRIAKRNLTRVLGFQGKKKRKDSPSPSSYRYPFQKPPQDKEIQFLRFIEWAQENQKNGYLFSAIQYFEAASNIHPEFIDPYLRIASCYEKLGEKEKAHAAYERALFIYPEDEGAQEGLRRCSKDVIYYRNTKNTAKSAKRNIIGTEEPSNNTKANDVFETDLYNIYRIEPEKADMPAPVTCEASIGKEGATGDIFSQCKAENVAIRRPADQSADAVTGKEITEEMHKNFLSKYIDEFLSHKWSAPVLSETLETPTNKTAEINKTVKINKTAEIQKTKEIIHQTNEKEEVVEGNEKGTNQISLTEEQIDALSELGNIGASHAATTLSTMLETPIYMHVQDIRVLSVDEISEYVGNDEATFAIFTMEGEVQQAGYLILQVGNSSVIQMSALLLGIQNESRKMNEMDESAIIEIGNIMVSAFLDGVAELLDIIMLPSPPRTIIGKATSVIHDIIDNGDIYCDNILLFKTEMMGEYEIKYNILLLPSQTVLYNILQMLERLIEEDEAYDKKRSNFVSYADWY